jgi:hypothetical protein
MVAYNDVPAVNILYMEQANIDNAINLLDNNGTITNFTVSPAPPDPGVMGAPMPSMPVSISTIAPSAALMAEARAALVARHDAITAELAALGVTDSPAAFGAEFGVEGESHDGLHRNDH